MSFWEKKLNNEKVQKPLLSNNMYGLYTPQIPAPQTVPAQPQYQPSVRTIQGSVCPGCGSDNYRANVGSYAIACPECGYHPRFEQSGYGEAHLSDKGARPTRQTGDSQTMDASVAYFHSVGKQDGQTSARVAPTQYVN